MNEKLLGPKALQEGINMRAIDRATNLERKVQENTKEGLDETVSFNELFGVQYIADPRGMEIRTYLKDESTAFIPENLKYMVDKTLEYADISYTE